MVARDTLKTIPGLRSAYYLTVALRQMAGDQWREPGSFDDIFSEQTDPWQSTSVAEQERFAVTMSVLGAANRESFANVVELGCAEGIFTEKLAPLSDSLTALDFSEVALERARERLGHSHRVTFRHWDMRHEPLRGEFDLVVAMGVLTSLYRPHDVRRIAGEVIDAIAPGGFLLFSDVRQSRVFEDAWWGRYVLRGGEQIRRLLDRNASIECVNRADTATHVFALYRRGVAR